MHVLGKSHNRTRIRIESERVVPSLSPGYKKSTIIRNTMLKRSRKLAVRRYRYYKINSRNFNRVLTRGKNEQPPGSYFLSEYELQQIIFHFSNSQTGVYNVFSGLRAGSTDLVRHFQR